MKKRLSMLAGFFVMGLAGYAWATGGTAIDVGNGGATYSVTLSSIAGTVFYSPALVPQVKSGSCKNYGSNIVFVATNTTTQHQATHWNILNGLPLGASDYFNLGGRFGGKWAGTCEIGVASCVMRCAFGKD